MELPIYQIDAFTGKVFAGNPAAVVLLPEWLDDKTLQNIAAENNLAETAYLVPQAGGFNIRWFTPTTEIDLCGHATLASGYVALTHGLVAGDRVSFSYAEGDIAVIRQGEMFALDFPARPPAPAEEMREEIARVLGAQPTEVLTSRAVMAVFAGEDDVAGIVPDFDAISSLDVFALIITAPGTRSDFVSRFFAPRQGIPEDPVTGAAHCTLVPYWSKRLGKKELHALQISSRGGELFCEDRGERVRIAGRAVEYLRGSIFV